MMLLSSRVALQSLSGFFLWLMNRPFGVDGWWGQDSRGRDNGILWRPPEISIAWTSENIDRRFWDHWFLGCAEENKGNAWGPLSSWPHPHWAIEQWPFCFPVSFFLGWRMAFKRLVYGKLGDSKKEKWLIGIGRICLQSAYIFTGQEKSP